MRKIFTLCALVCAAAMARAGEVILCDFENCNVGDQFTMVNIFGPTTSTAEVVVDPVNADNKVLHVRVDSWNTFVEYALPDGITGRNLLDHYQKVSFDLYRDPAQTNDYMQTAVLLGPATDGSTVLYWDSNYPYLGDKGVWLAKSYDLNRVYNESSTILLGLHCDVVEYYIDNIRLSGVSSAESDSLRWTAATSNVWDMGVTANFAPVDADYLSATPVVFHSGARALFDDNVLSVVAQPTRVLLDGNIEAPTVVFGNRAVDYTIASLNADATPTLSGGGQLIVDGGGRVTMGAVCQFAKGTVVSNSELRLGIRDAAAFGTSLLTDNASLYAVFNNTSSGYLSLSAPIAMADSSSLDLYLSRYSYTTPTITGRDVTLNIHAGGERVYLSTEKGNQLPDWSGFTGTVNVYPYKDVIANAGNYGIVMGHGGKTFNPAEIAESLESDKVNRLFENKTLVLHDGSTLACETGIRAMRIGELRTAPSSRIYGYYKASDTPRSYLMVGCSNTDSQLAGRIAPADKDGKPYMGLTVGLIKEGTGTYTLTNNENLITGGIQVLGGTLLVDNDAVAAEAHRLTGGTGYASEGTLIFVFEGATIGGCGNIADDTDVYGRLAPGSNGIGTLTLKNYATADPVNLYVRPTTVMTFDIASPSRHDSLVVDGDIIYYNITEDFMESDGKPVVEINFDDSYVYDSADEFVLVTFRDKSSLWGDPWSFELRVPDADGWTLEERATDDGTQLVLVSKEALAIRAADAVATTKVYTSAGCVCVEAQRGDVISIYSATGQLLKSVTATDGLNTIHAPAGSLIVNVNGIATKLINKSSL